MAKNKNINIKMDDVDFERFKQLSGQMETTVSHMLRALVRERLDQLGMLEQKNNPKKR